MPIGFTTGNLYRSNISFEDRINMYRRLGADAVELSFATPKNLSEFRLSNELKGCLRDFKHISIHAPWKEVTYETETAKKIISELERIYGELEINGIVLHPDVIHDYKILDKSGLPFLIENMDSRKNWGTLPEHIKEIREDYNFGFVLDVQHAYEQDSKMNVAKEIAKTMEDRLRHMHVSGNTASEIHFPVHCAENREAITYFLRQKIPATIILEGVLSSPYISDFESTARNELNYIRSIIE